MAPASILENWAAGCVDGRVRMRIGAIVMFVLALASGTGAAVAQGAAPQPIDIPPWFATTFLDFR